MLMAKRANCEMLGILARVRGDASEGVRRKRAKKTRRHGNTERS